MTETYYVYSHTLSHKCNVKNFPKAKTNVLAGIKLLLQWRCWLKLACFAMNLGFGDSCTCSAGGEAVKVSECVWCCLWLYSPCLFGCWSTSLRWGTDPWRPGPSTVMFFNSSGGCSISDLYSSLIILNSQETNTIFINSHALRLRDWWTLQL